MQHPDIHYFHQLRKDQPQPPSQITHNTFKWNKQSQNTRWLLSKWGCFTSAIFSVCHPAALSSQPSSVWLVICMKCSVLSCLPCLLCWLSDNDADADADACPIRRVHIRLERKWERLMATDVSELLETILVMGDWTGKEPILHKWRAEYFETFCKKGGHQSLTS